MTVIVLTARIPTAYWTMTHALKGLSINVSICGSGKNSSPKRGKRIMQNRLTSVPGGVDRSAESRVCVRTAVGSQQRAGYDAKPANKEIMNGEKNEGGKWGLHGERTWMGFIFVPCVGNAPPKAVTSVATTVTRTRPVTHGKPAKRSTSER